MGGRRLSDVDARALLEAYVDAHNEGVRTRDFGGLKGLLHAEAEMRFEGVSVGPFFGRESVLRAFAEDPPSAAIELRDVRPRGAVVEAVYGWAGAAAVASGTLTIEAEGGCIRRIVVHVWGNPGRPPPNP